MEITWRPSSIQDIEIQDIEHARRYLSRFNPSAATRVSKAIWTVVRTVASSPDGGRRGRVEGTRELAVPHTPYLIAYTVIGDQLIVLAVLHHAQDWPITF